MTVSLAAVLAASFAAAIFDIRARRIPNAVSIALALTGIAVNFFFGWQSGLVALAVIAAVLIAGTVAFSFRLIGGGDVKLLAAAAGTLGYPHCIGFILLVFLSGGIIAATLALMRGRLAATVSNVRGIALPLFAGAAPARPHNGIAMPYAVAIFAGAALWALLHTLAPHAGILP